VHGQLPAAQIEKAMWDFMHKKIDVLIASTIIESGLDIPSANTMIVEEAENFGLAQLYQLRGRIGREKQKAYCYLFYTPSLVKEDAARRLESLQESASLVRVPPRAQGPRDQGRGKYTRKGAARLCKGSRLRTL